MDISTSTASSRRLSQDFSKYERLLKDKDRDYPSWRVRRNTEQLKALQRQINTTVNGSYAFTAGTKEMDGSYKKLFVDFFREMRGGDHLTNQSGWDLAKTLCYEDIADRVERWVYEPEEPDHLEITYRPTEAFNRELMDLLDQCGGFNAQFLEALGRNSKCFIKGLELKTRDTYICSIPVFRRVFPRCYETLKAIFTDLLSSEWLQEDIYGLQEYTNQKTPVDRPLSLNHEGLRLWNDAKSKSQWQRNLDQQLTKKHENAWKNDLMSTAVSGALSYKTGNPVFIGSQLLRSFTNAISRNTDPEGKDLELQMLSTVANAGTGLVSGNLKAVGAGLAFDLADINNCFQERKSGVELSKGQEAGRNIAMLFAKSLITGNFHGDDERYLKEIIGGLTSEALHQIIEESDETTPWGARLLKVIAQHPDFQGLFVDQFMENQRHKKKELPQEESKAEEIRQPIEQEAIERERAIQEQYDRELADYNRELQEWQAKKEAHDQKIVEDKNRLTQKEAEVHQAEKKMLRRFNRYDKKNNKGFSSFLCDVGVQNASKEFNKYWKSREKYKNLFQEFNTLKAEQELTQEHPFAKFYKEPPKRGPIEKVYDKASKMLGKIGFSGGANVYTASASENKPSPFSTYQNQGIHHDLGQKPSEKPSIYQEGRHQIAVERSGLHEMEVSRSQQRGSWQTVQSFQEQRMFNENMSFRSERPMQDTPQPRIIDSLESYSYWGRGMARGVQLPPSSFQDARDSGIRNPTNREHRIPGIAHYPEGDRTQSNIPRWLRNFASGGESLDPQERIDRNTQVAVATITEGARALGAIADELRTWGCIGGRLQNGRLTLEFDRSTSERLDRFVRENIPNMDHVRNFHYVEFVAGIANSVMLQVFMMPFFRGVSPQPLRDRVLVRPEGFGRQLRAIESLQNPVYHSGIGSPWNEFVAGQSKKLTKKTVTKITPKNYFSDLTYSEVEKVLTAKFGPPKGGGDYNKSFYNPKTGRTFNLHQDPIHREGKPHIDIRKRGLSNSYYKDQPYFLKEDL